MHPSLAPTGLEFNNVILVNFFGTSDVSRGWEILTNLEWLKGNSDEQQESKKLLVEKAKEKKLPGDLEVDLKKLYTRAGQDGEALCVTFNEPPEHLLADVNTVLNSCFLGRQ